MDRNEVSKEATAALKRGEQYGSATRLFQNIAERWTMTLRHRHGVSIGILPDDVAMMMVDLKIARAFECPQHLDSVADIVGYAALFGELQGGVHNARLPEPTQAAPKPPVVNTEEIEAALGQFVKDSLAPLPVDKSVKTKV